MGLPCILSRHHCHRVTPPWVTLSSSSSPRSGLRADGFCQDPFYKCLVAEVPPECQSQDGKPGSCSAPHLELRGVALPPSGPSKARWEAIPPPHSLSGRDLLLNTFLHHRVSLGILCCVGVPRYIYCSNAVWVSKFRLWVTKYRGATCAPGLHLERCRK